MYARCDRLWAGCVSLSQIGAGPRESSCTPGESSTCSCRPSRVRETVVVVVVVVVVVLALEMARRCCARQWRGEKREEKWKVRNRVEVATLPSARRLPTS